MRGDRFEPRVERLRDALLEGLGKGASEEVRRELKLDSESPDLEAARSLVQIVSACSVAVAGEGEVEKKPLQPPSFAAEKEASGSTADTSLLGRLGADDTFSAADLNDVETLLGVLQAGSLRQRRAALARLVELHQVRELSPTEVNRFSELTNRTGDHDLELELADARERLGGGPARSIRAARERWAKLAAEVEADVRAYWEGESSDEPFAELPGDDRAELFLRARELPDLLINHVAAILEGDAGERERSFQREMLTSLRHAGDARLVPSLLILLGQGGQELAMEAARALRRTMDPRVRPSLAEQFERSRHDGPKALIAGALGEHGDARGREYVRSLLERDEVAVVEMALEALETLGTVEDTPSITKLLDHEDERVLHRAIRALQRVADGRGLKALRAVARSPRGARHLAELEEARETILARVDLRGEEVEPDDTSAIRLVPDERPTVVVGGKRFAAWRSYLIGQVWLAVGALQRGRARLERAATLRPGWVWPHLTLGMAFARRRQHALALASFRRAIEIDRKRVERQPLAIRAATRCFLRRAEQVAGDGRVDVARGLVAEARELDLRRVDRALRFELERRWDALRRAA